LRRNIWGIGGRVATVLGIIIVINLAVRIIYVFGGYVGESRRYFKPDYDLFWDVAPGTIPGGWTSYIVLHFFAVMAVGLIAVIIVAAFYGVRALGRWIFTTSDDSDEVECTDPECRCAMHGGTSYEDYRDEEDEDEDDSFRNAAMIAGAVAVGTTIGISLNSN
jgi:hypothetical protein